MDAATSIEEAALDVRALLEEHGHTEFVYRLLGFELLPLLRVSRTLGDDAAARFAFVTGALVGARLHGAQRAVDAWSALPEIERALAARGGPAEVVGAFCDERRVRDLALRAAAAVAGDDVPRIGALVELGVSFGLLAAEVA